MAPTGAVFIQAPSPPAPASPGPEQFGCSCCDHAACVPLREQALCQRWYFLNWVPSTTVMPSEILDQLRQRLKNRCFRHCGVLMPSGVYQILVRMDACIFTLRTRDLVPDPLAPLFHVHESRAWHLRCCRDALEDDAEVWLKSLRETEGRIFFGDKRLPHDLQDDVSAASGRDDEAYFSLLCGTKDPSLPIRKR